MKPFKQQSLVFLLTLLFAYSSADDAQAIRNLCRLRTGLFAHPNPFFCFQYIECVLVSGIIRTCPDENIWDQQDGSCVPGNIATCLRNTLPEPTLEPPIPTVELPTPPPIDVETICNEVLFGLVEIPGNCTHFVFCLFGSATVSACQAPTPVFDINREGCFAGNPETCEFFGPTPPPPTPPPTVDPPTLTPPTQGPPAETTLEPETIPPSTNAPPTPPIATTTVAPPPSLPPFNICVGNNMRFVADPSSCFKYFYCFFGIPLGGECESNRIFVELLQGCALGNQLTCERNRNINIEIDWNRPIFPNTN